MRKMNVRSFSSRESLLVKILIEDLGFLLLPGLNTDVNGKSYLSIKQATSNVNINNFFILTLLDTGLVSK